MPWLRRGATTTAVRRHPDATQSCREQRELARRQEREHLPGAKERVRAKSEVPEEDATPPRAAPRESALPWDVRILRQAGVSRPVGCGWDGEAVCGRGVAGGFRRGSITSGTAEIPSACGRCDAGRGRSGNGSAGPNLRDASGTQRRNASGENSGRPRPRGHRKVSLPPRTRLRSLARGHAAEGFRRFSAIVPVVMSLPGILFTPLRRIVATTAARPCIRPATANVSG